MSNEDLVRRALDYEIEPWTPDPAELIRGGRRIAMVRRAAAATAALAVAGTVGGVAMAVGGTSSSQPPVVATTPSPLPSTPPTVTTPPDQKAAEAAKCRLYLLPSQRTRATPKPTATPSAREPMRCRDEAAKRAAEERRKCTVYAVRGDRKALAERLAKSRGRLPCTDVLVIARPQPTTPVPTSVPAGL